MARTASTLTAALLGLLAAVAAAAPAPPGPRGKVDSTLRELLVAHARGTAPGFARSRAIRLEPGAGLEPAALVVVETAAAAAGEAGAIEAAGGRVVGSADASALAWVPLDRLEAVAALPRVLVVRRPVRAAWDVTSEGVALTGAGQTHARGGRGQGVRIGVIDVFQGYQAKLGGELPPATRVTFLSFIAGGGEGDSGHGVQVAEILTDMAPEASLYLAAIEDDVGYRQAVDWLLASGVRVINHSGGFGLFGDMRGNGPIHAKVGQAAGSGAVYVEAAGNYGRSHWEGGFTDGDGDSVHEFAPGVERIEFDATLPGALDLRVDLTWDDWKPDPADPRPLTDYDLCLYDAGGSEVACSTNPQSGKPGEVPFEQVSFTAPKPGKFSIGVLRKSGGDLRFEIGLIPDYDFGPLNVAASSLIVPADHPEAFTVGATSLADVIRPFSSLGPTNDGRIEPDLVAPDGVSTSLGIFFGTSAAAPHAAGAAAILLSLDGSLSVGQVRDRLRSQAVQVAADPVPGPDNVYGSGRLDADFSALATPTPPKKSGGGGCRVVDPADGGALPLLGALALVLLYGAWLRRRG